MLATHREMTPNSVIKWRPIHSKDGRCHLRYFTHKLEAMQKRGDEQVYNKSINSEIN